MDSPDYDSPWKDLLDHYFEHFKKFFFPAAYAQIDWARGVELLDKELQKITADAALGRRTVDKLVKVRLLTGTDVIALIHCEVQGYARSRFRRARLHLSPSYQRPLRRARRHLRRTDRSTTTLASAGIQIRIARHTPLAQVFERQAA